MEITKINENIYRTTLPYKDIFTTIYTIRTPQGVVLFDAGSFDTDAQEYILPFLKEVGVEAEELKYIFISHNHGDHAGGLKALAPHFSEACIASRSPDIKNRYTGDQQRIAPEDGEMLLDTLQVITIPGHTLDSMALLDKRTNTLVTGDCLQVYGIVGSQDWASNVCFPVEYLAALEKVRALDVDQIVTAHDYYPYGYRADGKEAVAQMIHGCIAPIRRMEKLIREHPELSDGQIRQLYNDQPNTPTVRVGVIAAMRQAILENRI